MKQIEIGHLQYEDFQQLLTAMKAAYPLWGGNYWREETIQKLIKKFEHGLAQYLLLRCATAQDRL